MEYNITEVLQTPRKAQKISERKRTYMRSISDELPFWNRLLSMLEAQFGDQYELVLHDLTRDYSETIVDIRNGNSAASCCD